MSDAIDNLFDPERNSPVNELDRDAVQRLLQDQANLIVSVGTGGPRIQDEDRRYQRSARVLNSNFQRLGLPLPFPWDSLWDWYGYYSANLDTYQSRRAYVGTLAREALGNLDALEARGGVIDPSLTDPPPNWENINRRITNLVDEYSTARDRDDWQDVGRRSREILIDFGKLTQDPDLVPPGTEAPKAADAKAWFDLFLACYAEGSDKSELRTTMRAVWALAQKVTHGDVADVDAFAAAQGTVLVVRTAQKLLQQAATDSP
ncbi:hypothetical protein HUN08_10970 [Gordonia sp. X0973]|uniref:hypothetical protein n=1 Tax=Gordonia sp. X0973 TaxID=2742602 RepID=UPI000F5357F7|nr:hypothetical protein [Gordonia sp. X0973]QKT07655.1 hypothetical protein HUN08_10970 [Gordonia sp. X0973]